jgi:hypothetical protein
MAWFRKKTDPLSDRAQALNDEIAELEAKIKKLDDRLQRDQPSPRSAAPPEPPEESTPYFKSPPPAPTRERSHDAPIFEPVDVERLNNHQETSETRDHYNELGMRKYDLPALLRRWRNHFRGPSTSNPKLVSYLAAGGIQGLRPLRYEKRVARNRFIALVLVLFFTLLGIILVFFRQHR